jgi:hypothetical protein
MLVDGKPVDKERVWSALYELKPGIEFSIPQDVTNALKLNIVKVQSKKQSKFLPGGQNSKENLKSL